MAMKVLRGRGWGAQPKPAHSSSTPRPTETPGSCPAACAVDDDWSNIDTVINHIAKCRDLTLLLVKYDLRWIEFVALMVSVGPEA